MELINTKDLYENDAFVTASNFNRKGPGGSQTAVTGSFFYSCLHRDIFTFHPQRYAARNGKPFPAAGNPQACR